MTSAPAASDAELMRRVQAGERECFAALIERYQRPLLRVAESQLHGRAAAEDAVQEAFLAAFKSRHTFRPEANFRTWLWTILLNLLKRHAGRAAREPKAAGWLPDSPGGDAPLARLLARERSELLTRLLDELPAPQADALRLRFFGEMTFPEIAETLGCSLLTARNRVQAGLGRLAERLTDDKSISKTTSTGIPETGERT